MPNNGIWQQTRKMNSVMAVHSTFSRNWICGGREQKEEEKGREKVVNKLGT